MEDILENKILSELARMNMSINELKEENRKDHQEFREMFDENNKAHEKMIKENRMDHQAIMSELLEVILFVDKKHENNIIELKKVTHKKKIK